jgi:hypothetical protein
MRDAIDHRIWDAHHDRFSSDLHSLFVNIGAAISRLYRIQWRAPWLAHGASRGQRAGQA